ncbi:MAG: histidine kinase [Armatimonadetes bacterium]|nr:histidine kinase [Armatimonadota bacterium]
MKLKQGHVVELEIPSAPEYVSIVRRAVEGLARRMEFSEVQIEDLKLAVGEACTNAVRHGCADNDLRHIAVRCMVMDEGLAVEIRNDIRDCRIPTVPAQPDVTREGGFGLYLIRKLMDEVDIVWEPETAVVKMLKRLSPTAV